MTQNSDYVFSLGSGLILKKSAHIFFCIISPQHSLFLVLAVRALLREPSVAAPFARQDRTCF